MIRAARLVVLIGVVLGACDGGGPPPPPTVPETIPAPEQVEACADLVDAALGLLQGQLDALAAADLDGLLDPAGTLPAALRDLEPASSELADRAGERCAPGELAGLVAARAGELRATGAVARRYLDVLVERVAE